MNETSKLKKYLMWYKVRELFSSGLNKSQISLSLGLPRLLECEAHLAQEQGKTHVGFLHDLLVREVQERDSKDFQRRLKAAALPARHDLDLFDHNYSQGITAPRLRDLRRLGWLAIRFTRKPR